MVDFQQALTQTYLENPCQVLPNPLWKTLAALAPFRLTVESGRDGLVNRLEAADADNLYLLWTRASRRPSLLMRRRLESVRRALIHQDYLDPDTAVGFDTRRGFFRLIYRGVPAAPALTPGFRFAAARPEHDAETIAAVIARLPSTHPPTADSVREWGEQPVFAPDCWLWVMDETSGQPAALGIVDVDVTIGEGALEWLQVLPDYRGQGIGRALTLELLRRAISRAAFVTVSGAIDRYDTPGGFYRTCGFSGGDIWWLLERRG